MPSAGVHVTVRFVSPAVYGQSTVAVTIVSLTIFISLKAGVPLKLAALMPGAVKYFPLIVTGSLLPA